MTAAEYREHWMKHRVWLRMAKLYHQTRIKWCADQCVGETFADVGCACGHSTAAMAKLKPGHWSGIDFDSQMIDQAESLFPEMRFYLLPGIADLHTLGKFDSVICSEVIEHIADDRELVAQLWAITGKKLIVTTTNRDAHDPGHLRIYGMKKLMRIFNPSALGDLEARIHIESIGRFWCITAERREA